MKAKEVKIASDTLEKFMILSYPVFVYYSVYVQCIPVVCFVMFWMRKNVNFPLFSTSLYLGNRSMEKLDSSLIL